MARSPTKRCNFGTVSAKLTLLFTMLVVRSRDRIELHGSPFQRRVDTRRQRQTRAHCPSRHHMRSRLRTQSSNMSSPIHRPCSCAYMHHVHSSKRELSRAQPTP